MVDEVALGQALLLFGFALFSVIMHHNSMSAVTVVKSVVKENTSHVTTKIFRTNNFPTRCNKKQCTYYSASSLYMFRVSATPIIRSTQNCNYSLWCCVATSLQRWREVAAQKKEQHR